MVEPYVTFILNRFGTVLDEDIKLARGVKRDIEAARSEFQRILAFLLDADDLASRGNREVRSCLIQIRWAVWDFEDILASVSYKADRRRRQSRWRRRIRVPAITGVSRHDADVARKLKSISDQLSECRSKLQSNGVGELVRDGGTEAVFHLTPQQIELRRCVSRLSDEIMHHSLSSDVGELAGEMTRSDPGCCRIFAICAMGGSGKTTMARLVYNHQTVRGYFTRFAWVQIGPQFKQEDVWSKILTDLCGEDYHRSGDLAETLSRVLTELRCLVVIDDVWELTTWERLRQGFPGSGSTTSRILITTRNKQLDSRFGPISFLCEPQLLCPDESWTFFTTKANFKGIPLNQADKEEMERLGKEMIKFCFGLPLALEVLAGVLCRKRTVREWENIHVNVKKYIRTGDICENVEKEKDLGVSWVLSLSYEELSHNLKQCFLHLAHFADDNISMNELYRMWIAEDIVSSEDKAAEYFNKLVDRYLVQVVERSLTGGVKRYAMNGLIRDLCLTKARDENFLQIKDFANRHREEASRELSVHSRARRLVVTVDEETKDELAPLISETPDCVRSLVCLSTAQNPDFEPALKPLLKKLRRLRVLKFGSQTRGEIGKLPSEILKLVHLRLLSLKDINVSELPQSFSKLRRLQTLDLRTNWKLEISNKTLSGLSELRHLYLPQQIGIRGEKKLKLDKLKNLRTLVNAPTKYCDLDGLSRLPHLRKLKVRCGGGSDGVETTMGRFPKLESLAVDDSDAGPNQTVNLEPLISSCPKIVKLRLEVKMKTLPESVHSCSKLQKLTLRGCHLETDPMETLRLLPRLKVVKFDEDAFSGKRMDCSPGGFAALECLYFVKLPEFNELVLAAGVLPSLRRMVIVNCPNFTTARGEIQRFVTVGNVEIN